LLTWRAVDVAGSERVAAWRPAVPGVAEVLHARMVTHAYPRHVHDVWTLLIVDDGAIRYDLDRHEHGADPAAVTLLPPGVVHDGRAATTSGFRKRVIYLDGGVLAETLVGAAVRNPYLFDRVLRRRVHQLHVALGETHEELQAESRLALIGDRLRGHLSRVPWRVADRPRRLADDLRDLLDAHLVDGLTLRAAGEVLGAHPAHLVRAFTAAFGLPPHAYLTSRRIDEARRRLLAGQPAHEVAVAVGFYDQPHLTRHFRRYLCTTPAEYAHRRNRDGGRAGRVAGPEAGVRGDTP
jgi:AraC-like DNA-binding protein